MQYFPWVQLVPEAWVRGLAGIGGLGTHFRRRAPGTWGSAAGLVWYAVLFHFAHPLGYLLLLLASFYVAWAICDELEARLDLKDPNWVILDEFVAVPLCFLGLQPAMAATGQHMTWAWLLAGFALFRLFDTWKPLFIDKLQDKPGGAGVVLDDAAAAGVTCILLHGAAVWLT